MTVLYVDLEHDRVRTDPVRGPAHDAAIEGTRTLLETLSGQPCDVTLAAHVTPSLAGDAAPRAIVLSGCTTDWSAYDLDQWVGLQTVIRDASIPILGICAGHQLIGHAHGAAWGPLGPLAPGEEDTDPRFAPGHRKQRGFMTVTVDPASPLFAGLEAAATVFQSHYWQLEDVPAGFVGRASSAWSPIQAIERTDRPVFGVQFHPERSDDAHPAGLEVLRRFFGVAGTAAS